MVIDPDSVTPRFGRKRPIDGGFTAAFAIALKVVFEEFAAGFLLGKVVAQIPNPKDLAGFLFDVGTALTPDNGERIADSGDDVLRVAVVIDEDAGPGDAQWVVVGHVGRRGGQAVGILEHAGRADGQWVEGIGQLGRLALAGGVADVPAAEGVSKQTRNKGFCLL